MRPWHSGESSCIQRKRSWLMVTVVGQCVYWEELALAKRYWPCTEPSGLLRTVHLEVKRYCSPHSPRILPAILSKTCVPCATNPRSKKLKCVTLMRGCMGSCADTS